MLEMIGVLAIIRILSFGGIAGHSKVMEKYKTNRTLDEYNNLMFGFFSNLDEIKQIDISNPNNLRAYYSFLQSLELVPLSWKYNSTWLTDSMGDFVMVNKTILKLCSICLPLLLDLTKINSVKSSLTL